MSTKKFGAALGILLAALLALYTLYFGASLPDLLEAQVLPEVAPTEVESTPIQSPKEALSPEATSQSDQNHSGEVVE